MGIRILIYVVELLPFKLLILTAPAIIAWRRTRSLPYSLCFVLFGIYLLTIVQVALLPLDISPEYADMMRRDASWQQNINLIPFYFGPFNPTLADVWETNALNVLLTIPFGFGLSFVARVRPRSIFWIAPAVGFVIEASQMIISLLLGYPYRIVDINDVLMNALGVLVGYGIFRAFAWLTLWMTRRFSLHHAGLAAYIHDVARRTA